MTFHQFCYIYENSIEARRRIAMWLQKHPAPPGVSSLKWACHKFIEEMIARKATAPHMMGRDFVHPTAPHLKVSDPDRFTVPKSAMLEEARRRAELGEDAGAAYNLEQEKHYPKRMRKGGK